MGTLHNDISTFMKISRQILLTMRNVSDRSSRENQNTKHHSLTTLTEVFPCFSSVVRQRPWLNSRSRGTDRISSELLSFVLCLSLCYTIVFMLFCFIMLYCYCVALLLFVLSYVLIVCTVPLPPGVNPIAVDKYIKVLSNQSSVTSFRKSCRL